MRPMVSPQRKGRKSATRVSQEEDRNRSEAGGEGREDADERYGDDFRHARPYPV